jgi:hypothetical protein
MTKPSDSHAALIDLMAEAAGKWRGERDIVHDNPPMHRQEIGAMIDPIWQASRAAFADEVVRRMECQVNDSLSGSPDDYPEQCYRRGMRNAIAIVKEVANGG